MNKDIPLENLDDNLLIHQIRKSNKLFLKIQNVAEVLSYLDLFYKYTSQTLQGYVVTIRYTVSHCVEKVEKNEDKKIDPMLHRTFKCEGNYYEVKNAIREWGEEKMEIYNLSNLSLVLCYDAYFRTAMLIYTRKTYDVRVLESDNKIYTAKRAGSIFHAIAQSLHDVKWASTIHAKELGVRDLLKLPIEDQIEVAREYFSKYILKSRKLKTRYSLGPNGQLLLNIAYDPKKLTIYRDRINLVQMEGGFYSLEESSIQLIEEDQRPIHEPIHTYVQRALIIAYDFEWNWVNVGQKVSRSTLPKQINVRYGTVYECLGSKRFTGPNCCSDFLDFIIKVGDEYEYKYGTKPYCMAHNASTAEHVLLLSMLIRYIENDNYTLVFNHVTSTKIHSFQWRGRQFRDTYLFAPGSLNNYAKAMGVPGKKEIDIDWDTADWDNPTEEMNEYAAQDAIVLYNCIVKHNEIYNRILKTNHVWYFHFRSGSSISKYYLVQGATQELMFNNLKMTEQLKHFYYGGRTEIFYKGSYKKFHREVLSDRSEDENYATAIAIKLDINSSYPYAMCQALPGRFLRMETDLSRINRETESFEIFGYLIYKESYWENFNFSLIAVKDEDRKLVFPNYTGPSDVAKHVNIKDFEYDAIKDHIEIKIKSIIVYQKITLFRSKIISMFEARKETDQEAMKYVLKFMMNSGYGSFGLKPDRERLYLVKGSHVDRVYHKFNTVHAYALDTQHIGEWKMLSVTDQVEVSGIMQIASHTTALARFTLWKEMERLSRQGFYILYVDTDSIICVDLKKRTAPEITEAVSSMTGEELGQWKIESMSSTWFIAGLKMYKLGDEIVCKGVHSPKLDDEGLWFKSQQEVEVWKRSREGYIEREIIIKNLSFEYTKGHVSIGGVVTPLNR